jgi:TRAP-type C4-dicarboxylate transport system permease small subunit
LLKISLLLVATLVLYQLFTLGLEFFQRGFRTRAASFQLSRAWIYLAMPVCFGTMLLVNIELILIELKTIFGGNSNESSELNTGEHNKC